MATDPIVYPVDEEVSFQEPGVGRNVSAQHHAILQSALDQTCSRLFNELLASMPNVGEDSDFARSRE